MIDIRSYEDIFVSMDYEVLIVCVFIVTDDSPWEGELEPLFVGRRDVLRGVWKT